MMPAHPVFPGRVAQQGQWERLPDVRYKLTSAGGSEQLCLSLRPDSVLWRQRNRGRTKGVQVGEAGRQPVNLRLARGIQIVLIKEHSIVLERLNQHMMNATLFGDGKSKCFSEGRAEIRLPAIRRDIDVMDIVPEYCWDHVANLLASAASPF